MPRKPAVAGVDRRQQILEAALSVFAERGFEAATNKEITERAGVNQGLIYFYFAFILVHPSGEQLAEIASLCDAGQLKVHIEAAFPLQEVAQAHRLSEDRHVRGKLVLSVA